jgi:hypothetical protein
MSNAQNAARASIPPKRNPGPPEGANVEARATGAAGEPVLTDLERLDLRTELYEFSMIESERWEWIGVLFEATAKLMERGEPQADMTAFTLLRLGRYLSSDFENCDDVQAERALDERNALARELGMRELERRDPPRRRLPGMA